MTISSSIILALTCGNRLPVVAFLLKPYFRLAFNSRLPYRIQRLLLEAGAPLQQVPAGAVVRPLELACRPAEKITVGATERPTAVLYLHGGAYTLGSLSTHRSLAAHLARECPVRSSPWTTVSRRRIRIRRPTTTRTPRSRGSTRTPAPSTSIRAASPLSNSKSCNSRT